MKLLKKGIVAGAAIAASALVGTAAQAANYTVPLQFDSSTSTYTANFGSNVTGAFSDTFTFLLPQTGSTSGFSFSSVSVSTKSVITNLSGYVDSAANAFSFGTQSLGKGVTLTTGGVGLDSLATGLHSITLSGNTGSASLSGTINIVAAAVPEPATWAMMIGGVGIAGGALRRRKRATVTFAAA